MPVILRNDGEGLVQLIISDVGQVLYGLHDGSRVELVVFDGLGELTPCDREEVRQAYRLVDHVDRVVSTVGRPRLHRNEKWLNRRVRRRRGQKSRHRTTNVHGVACLRTNLLRLPGRGCTQNLLHMIPLRNFTHGQQAD